MPFFKNKFLHLHCVRLFVDAALNSCRESSIQIPVKECISVFAPPPHVVFSKGLPVLSGGDCLREQEEGMGGLVPSETLRTEDNGPVDPKGSPVKEQVSENLHGCESGVKVWVITSCLLFLNMSINQL